MRIWKQETIISCHFKHRRQTEVEELYDNTNFVITDSFLKVLSSKISLICILNPFIWGSVRQNLSFHTELV
jgi:hypothetical protein